MADEIIFESLEEGSFDGIVIPVQSVKIRTGSRKAFHVFPFRPGHDIEYMGREAVAGTITAVYVNGLDDVGGSNVLWPGTIETLRNRVQEQRSGPLVIPTLGKLPFASLDITDEGYDPDFVDGTRVTLTFSEDSADQFAGLTVSSAKGKLAAAASKADAAVASAGLPEVDEVAEDGTSLGSYAAWVNNILGQIDQVGDSIERPIRQLSRLAQTAENVLATVESLRSPQDWEIASTMRELVSTASDAIAEVTRSRDLKTFTTAGPTTLIAISRATSNSVAELLALNEVYDPNDIAAGETLLVFAK